MGQPLEAFGEDRLFVPVPSESVDQANEAGETLPRARIVRINWPAIEPDTRQIRLNLFETLDVTAVRHRIDTSVTGGYVWVGKPENQAGSVTLAVYNNTLSGRIALNGQPAITVNSMPGGSGDLYIIRERDPRAPEPNGPDTLLPPQPLSPPASLSTGTESCQEDGSVIDIMVIYTTAAREAMGGTDAALAKIDQLISEMNTANKTSQAPFLWRLVAADEVAYSESGSLGTDLSNLQAPGDGKLDQVLSWRDANKADLVTMIVAEGNQNACGIAYQMNDPAAWFGNYAFSVSAWDYPGEASCSEFVMAHELGHSVGNAHDRANAGINGPFGYSFGYQSLADSARFRDIMSYNCPGGCPRINQWANPDIFYMGVPTGIDFEADPANAADLVRSMNNTRQIVANFRPSCVDEPVATDTPLPLPTATPTVEATLTPTALPTASPTALPTVTATATATSIPPLTATPTTTATTAPVSATPTTSATSPAPIYRLFFLPMVIRK